MRKIQEKRQGKLTFKRERFKSMRKTQHILLCYPLNPPYRGKSQKTSCQPSLRGGAWKRSVTLQHTPSAALLRSDAQSFATMRQSPALRRLGVSVTGALRADRLHRDRLN